MCDTKHDTGERDIISQNSLGIWENSHMTPFRMHI